MKPNEIIRCAKKIFKKDSPEILIGASFVLGGIGIYELGKASFKAKEVLDAKKKEEHVEKLSAKETVGCVWKYYIFPAACFTASAACVIGADVIRSSRGAALASACAISEGAFAKYREKVKETVGEETARDISAKAVDRKAIPEEKAKEIIVTKPDERQRFLDYASGRIFESTPNMIDASVNRLNRNMISEMTVSQNEFYTEIGLREIGTGDIMGWHIDHDLIRVDYSEWVECEDGKPARLLKYNLMPIDFD